MHINFATFLETHSGLNPNLNADRNAYIGVKQMIDLIFGVLTPLSALFQLYHGDQF